MSCMCERKAGGSQQEFVSLPSAIATICTSYMEVRISTYLARRNVCKVESRTL